MAAVRAFLKIYLVCLAVILILRTLAPATPVWVVLVGALVIGWLSYRPG